MRSRSNWARAPNTWKMSSSAGRRGVDRFGKGSQAGAVFFQLVYGLDQMRERTREAIELPSDENIALSHEGDGLRQTGAVCLGARCAILENTVTPGGAQGVELERHLLLERRNSCITDLDHCDFSGLVRFSVRQSSCPACHCQEMFPDSGAIDRQRMDCRTRDWRRDGTRRGKAFPLTGAKVAGAPPSAGRPRNAPSVRSSCAGAAIGHSWMRRMAAFEWFVSVRRRLPPFDRE